MNETLSEVRDQFAHIAAAAAAVLVVANMLNAEVSLSAGAMIGFMLALPREHAQHGFKGIWQGKGFVDILNWVSGGLFAAFFV